MRIAIATNANNPNLDGGEKLLPDAFRVEGYKVDVIVWDDPTIDWSQYQTVIIRACWGYHQKIQEFLAWLQILDDMQVNVQNSTDIIRWNIHKKYLLDLVDRGVQIPRTVLVKQGDASSLKSIISALEDDEFVIKPCYGAAAFGIIHSSKQPTTEEESAFNTLLQHSDVLIQTYIPDVKKGEISAIFIGNIFSHAVLKIPKTGDFRSNYEFGGTEKKHQLSQQEISNLSTMYQKCQVDALYARLDVVKYKDSFTVIELELIEPYLFFEYGESSAERFIQAFIEQTAT